MIVHRGASEDAPRWVKSSVARGPTLPGSNMEVQMPPFWKLVRHYTTIGPLHLTGDHPRAMSRKDVPPGQGVV